MKITLLAQQLLKWRLFSRRPDDVSTWEIIKWWEIRRIAFNAIVGATGVFTCFAGIGAYWLMDRLGLPAEPPDPPLFILAAIVAYGVMANVCFTGGWVAEIIAKRLWEGKAAYFGEIAFLLGLAFSVALTFLPLGTLLFIGILGLLLR